jgi:hypothetical protein
MWDEPRENTLMPTKFDVLNIVPYQIEKQCGFAIS